MNTPSVQPVTVKEYEIEESKCEVACGLPFKQKMVPVVQVKVYYHNQ